MLNECPCCKQSFTKWNYGNKINVKSCGTLEGYGCFHCISCGHQLSRPMKGEHFKYIFVGLLGAAWLLARYIGNSIPFLDGINKFFVDIPIMAVLLFLAAIGSFYIFSFRCVESGDQPRAAPEEVPFLVKHIAVESTESYMKFLVGMIIAIIVVLIISVFY